MIYVVTAAYFAGTLAAGFICVPLWVSGIATVASAAAAVATRKSIAVFTVFISLLSFSVSLFVYETDFSLKTENSLTEYLDARRSDGAVEKVWGTIVRSGRGPRGGKPVLLRAEAVRLSPEKTAEVTGTVAIYMPYNGIDFRGEEPDYGERWSFEGRMKQVRDLTPGARRYSMLEGISARMYAAQEGGHEKLGEGGVSFLMGFGDRLRRRFERVMEERIEEPYRGILGRMLLGKSVEINKDAEDKFRRAGLAHVLVVSGMHVWFMLMTFMFLSFMWNRRPVVSFIILSAVLAMYYAVTGGGPSIMRATVMGFVFLAALLFGADYRARTALFLAALIMMVVKPLSIYQVGTQLTFLASAGVIFIYPVIASFFPGRAWWFRMFRGFLVAVAAQLPIYPVLAYYFNQFCAVSPVSNLVVVPMMGVVLPLDLLTCVSGILPGPAAAVPAFLAEWVARFMLAAAGFFSSIPYSNLEVASPSISWICMYEAGLFFLVLALKWTHEKSDRQIMSALATFGVCVAVLIVPFIWNPPLSGIRATFIDVGEGDSVLVEVPLEEKGTRVFRMLVDAGGSWGYAAEDYDPGEKSVGRYLKKKGIRRLDAVVLSHPEADHMNGMVWILENVKTDLFMDIGMPESAACGVMEDEEFCSAEPAGGVPELAPSQAAIYEKLLRTVKEKDVEYILMRTGLEMELPSGARIQVLAPDEEFINAKSGGNSFNNMSGVIRVTYGAGSVLLAGDIELEAERWLADYQGEKLKSDLLKVPHHGSSNSSSWIFLNRVGPDAAVVTTGGPAYYGHPHRSVLNTCKKMGIDLFRTDEDGNVRCSVSGRGNVKCKKEFSRLRF